MLIAHLSRILDGSSTPKTNPTPASPSVILSKDEDGLPRKESWNFSSIHGMLTYFDGTLPDIAYATN